MIIVKPADGTFPSFDSRAVTGFATRVLCATAVVSIVVSMFAERWQAAEAAIVVEFLHLSSDDVVHRLGDQIVVLGGPGHTFSAHIEAWCSSFVLVALFGAYASIVAKGGRRLRGRSFALGASVIVAGNLVRIAATVSVGIRLGSGSIEGFHDKIAVWFAVGVVLAGFGLFVLGMNPSPPLLHSAFGDCGPDTGPE